MHQVLVFRDPASFPETDYTDLLNALKQDEELTFVSSAYRDLSIFINVEYQGKKHGIYLGETPLEAYRAVYIKNSLSRLEEAKTIAEYLKANHVPFVDTAVGSASYGAKLFQMMKLAQAGLRVPATLYFSRDCIATKFSLITELIQTPFIMKDATADGGERNYLINSEEEFQEKITQNADAQFIMQEFIPNTFDYRLSVLNFRVASIKKRVRVKEGEHRNNVYAGAEQEMISTDSDQVSGEIKELSEKSAALFQLEIAGADVLVSDKDSLPYILEVNNAPGQSHDEESQQIAYYLGSLK